MCDPVTTSLMIASAGASYAGNKKAQGAMEDAVNAEAQRQKVFRDRQAGILDQSVASRTASRTKAEIDADAASQVDAYGKNQEANDAGQTAAPVAGPSGASSANVSDSYSRETSRANEAGKGAATRQAALSAFGNTMQAQQLNNTKYAQDSSVLANMSQGSLAVMPYEVQAGSHAGDSLKTLSQVLSLASIYSGYQASVGKALGPATWSEMFASAPVAEVASSTAPAIASQGEVATAGAKVAPFDATKYSTYPGAAKPLAATPVNAAYTGYPAGGAGPPTFNMQAAMPNGYQAQAGNYVGGVNVNAATATTEFDRLRRLKIAALR